MPLTLTLTTTPEQASNQILLKEFVARKENISVDKISEIVILKKSIDARKSNVKIQLKVEVYKSGEIPKSLNIERKYKDVTNADEVIIIGAGPAGLFAALKLLEKGLKPIIFERGKDVRSRRRDIASINKKHIVDNDSNYCFGEGGAGTYSDGKLYTRSKKRGSVLNILETLVFHGATEQILIDSQPHIGTNKLPKIIHNIKQSIIDHGGEVHFQTKIVDFIIKDNTIIGVKTQDGNKKLAKKTILATGHSARDIFTLLYKKGIEINYKPFAMGIRIEHPQTLIDQIQYSSKERGDYLPPANYKLVTQVKDRGVYSFCMCPGGFIVPSATNKGEIVVNGMSPSKRNSLYANSGIVVEVKESDLLKYEQFGPLKGLKYQMEIEQKACENTPNFQIAPAQKMVDFINNKKSTNLNSTSYQPGIISTQMSEILPPTIGNSLKQGFKIFDKKMNGFLTNQANIIGIESRTSSPVMIPRNKISLQHISIKNLYPCGEGAGYAGGIVSAAIDGINCADKC
ncbi:MAG: NAD(P)/FAD-dependent oxidoreductase [Flavobacteriales bacterium]